MNRGTRPERCDSVRQTGEILFMSLLDEIVCDKWSWLVTLCQSCYFQRGPECKSDHVWPRLSGREKPELPQPSPGQNKTKTHSGCSKRQRYISLLIWGQVPLNMAVKDDVHILTHRLMTAELSYPNLYLLRSAIASNIPPSSRHSIRKPSFIWLSHQVRLNLFPLKITIYQDNLPFLPHTDTPPHLLPNVSWTRRRMWWQQTHKYHSFPSWIHADAHRPIVTEAIKP